jgi:hypothetical protein
MGHPALVEELQNCSAAALDVEVFYVEGVVFDEFAALFYVFAHEGGEDLVGFYDVFELDLKQSAVLGVHSGFPELGRGHFAQTLVALD